jgi:hypothetical protein
MKLHSSECSVDLDEVAQGICWARYPRSRQLHLRTTTPLATPAQLYSIRPPITLTPSGRRRGKHSRSHGTTSRWLAAAATHKAATRPSHLHAPLITEEFCQLGKGAPPRPATLVARSSSAVAPNTSGFTGLPGVGAWYEVASTVARMRISTYCTYFNILPEATRTWRGNPRRRGCGRSASGTSLRCRISPQ